MNSIRFLYIALFLTFIVACTDGGTGSTADGDQSGADHDGDSISDGDTEKDTESDAGSGDRDSDAIEDGDREIDAENSDTEIDQDQTVDGDREIDRESDSEIEPEKEIDRNENCICDPSDPLSCGPEYHCSEDCLRCEMDNPPDEDEPDGDADPDNQQIDHDYDPFIEHDRDSSDTPVDGDDNTSDGDINQSCSFDGDCPYGSYCSFDTTVPHCAVDCVDNIDCVACCDKAIGRCIECPIEPDSDPDSDADQIHTCPNGQTSECPAGYYCLPNGICDKECDTLHPCEDPYVCNDHGQCVTPMGDEDI